TPAGSNAACGEPARDDQQECRRDQAATHPPKSDPRLQPVVVQLLWPVIIQGLPVEREQRFKRAWSCPKDRKVGRDPACDLKRGFPAAESFARLLHAFAEFVPTEPEAGG